MNTTSSLAPITDCFFVTGDDVSLISSGLIKKSNVGTKAYGLSSVPKEWTKPFFVIDATETPTKNSITNAISLSGISKSHKVMVRSSGVDESIEHRGSLDSSECLVSNIIETLDLLKSKIATAGKSGKVFWIVQELVPANAKGHLSNELRVCKDLRDWLAEIETSKNVISEQFPIAIRTWRQAIPLDTSHERLVCTLRVKYDDALKPVASWAYKLRLRAHFEWVWDGAQIFIVQADECFESDSGSNPKNIVNIQKTNFSLKKADLQCFRVVGTSDYSKYKKLKNSSIYRNIGYEMPDFYILDIESEVSSILAGKGCSRKLLEDLVVLTKTPLVIRTDGANVPSEKRVMLPRSDELRSVSAAQKWLEKSFKEAVEKLELSNTKLCLIAHHYIPSASAAWCQASPDSRRVRIESLWGIPEGVYWYSHDVFDVDTIYAAIPNEINPNKKLNVKERLRYKGHFIAPNENGDWIVHKTHSRYTWARSIRNERWIDEIAWNTRRIAQKEGNPVVVMWFVDIPNKFSAHRVIPWYHEEWESHSYSHKAAPRKKIPSSSEFTLSTLDNWTELTTRCSKKEHFERVIVNPTEPSIVRDQDFAKKLAALSKANSFVIELSGGILSHAYYLLSSEGCNVECSDLFAVEDERIDFNKLVRDKIPDVIIDKGENVEILRLHSEALLEALRRKIVEEALEVADSKTTQQLIEELADLQEVILAISRHINTSSHQINKVRSKKKAARGGFENGTMLAKTILPTPLTLSMPDQNTEHPHSQKRSERSISNPIEMPDYFYDTHVDKRRDNLGVLERQITLSLPAHAIGYNPSRSNFSLETQEGHPHDLTLEVSTERRGVDLKLRIRLINAPLQLSLFK